MSNPSPEDRKDRATENTVGDDLSTRIVRCLDGELSAEEHAALGEILRSDQDARDAYVETSLTSGALFERFEEGGNGESSTRRTIAGSAIGTGQSAAWSVAGIALAVAATLAAILLAPPADEPATGDRLAAGADATAPDAIGRVVRKIDCVWRDEAWSVGSSTHLPAGQTLRLERGFMEILLRNGIVVVLDGPTEFTLASLDSGVLSYGGVAVRVPEGSEGYVVDTPTARLTDLGTEFAVSVDSSGGTDLRVLEGEVAVSERKPGVADLEEEQLIGEDANWSSTDDPMLAEAKTKAAFLDTGLLSSPPFVRTRELPVLDGLTLWLAADMAVRTDEQRGVIAWGDASSQVAEERESAWQVDPRRRPLLLPKGVHGMPSIRFDGRNDYLITEPLETGNNQSVFVVARQRREKVFGKMPRSQLINYNGPPHLRIEHRWPDRVLTARAFAGYDQSPYRSGAVNGPTVQRNELFAVGFIYDHDANRAELFVNGESCGVADASIAIASRTAKMIGLHRPRQEGGFGGDIAEIAIYDRALAGDEVATVFDALMDRYTVGTPPMDQPL